jgi:signal peptidase I
MATVSNILGIEGKLGDLVIYKLNGKYVARRIGKISEDKYKNGKNYEAMRQNMMEFGTASMLGKVIRRFLNPYSKKWGDVYLSGRLNKVLKEVINKGIGKKGERKFDIVQNGFLLDGFELNAGLSYTQIVKRNVGNISISANRNEVVLIADNLVLKEALMVPKGANVARIVLVAFGLSYYSFDNVVGKYKPSVEMVNERDIAISDWMNVGDINSYELTCKLDPLDAKMALIYGLGVEFGQKLDTECYELETNRVMKIFVI